jgi:hypothetical protein
VESRNAEGPPRSPATARAVSVSITRALAATFHSPVALPEDVRGPTERARPFGCENGVIVAQEGQPRAVRNDIYR